MLGRGFGNICEWSATLSASSLEGALEVGSARHCTGTGFGLPGRRGQRSADALSLDLRARNDLLIAAGLTPAHTELDIEDHAMTPIRRVVWQVLDNHASYPGMATGPDFSIVAMNQPAEALFSGIRSMVPADIAARWFPDHSADSEAPVVTLTVVFDGQPVRTITTVTRFDKPNDITTAELRVELMFPADAEAETFFRRRVP